MLATSTLRTNAAALALVLVVGARAAADTLTVPQQFETIQAAVDAASAGDTVSIAAGLYAGQIMVPPGKDGLVIAGKGKVVLDCHEFIHGLNIQSNGVTARNLEIRHAAGAGIVAAPTLGPPATLAGLTLERLSFVNSNALVLTVDGAQILDCELDGTLGGIEVYGDDALISGVTIRNDGGKGIYVFDGDGTRITGCRFENVFGDAVDVFGDEAVVERNRFSAIAGRAIRIAGDDALVARNTVNDTLGAGVAVFGLRGAIDRNKLTACAERGILVEGADARVTSNRVSGAATAIPEDGDEGGGIHVEGDGALVARNQVARVIALSGIGCIGAGGTVEQNKVEDVLGNGFLLTVQEAVIRDNQASRCGVDINVSLAGIALVGDANTVESNTVRDCTPHGVRIRGADNTLLKNKSTGNAVNGIRVMSDKIDGLSTDNVIERNACSGNGAQGLLNQGLETVILGNRFVDNLLDLSNTTLSGATLIDQGDNVFETGGLEAEPFVFE